MSVPVRGSQAPVNRAFSKAFGKRGTAFRTHNVSCGSTHINSSGVQLFLVAGTGLCG